MTSRSSKCLTRHGTAVPLARYVRDDDGAIGAEFTDPNDPASALMEQEERELTTAPAGREDVLELLMSYLMGVDPHPAHVLRRLWLALLELAPHLTAGVTLHEAALLKDPSPIGHAWRVKMIVRGTRHAKREPSTQDRIIRAALASAWSKRPALALESEVPLETLSRLRPGETIVEFGNRQTATLALLQFFYVASQTPGLRTPPRPEAVLRYVFLVAKSLTPQLILNMSLQNLGDMFGEERATWSHHGKHKLAAFLAARGAQGFRAPHQKSEAACASYAAAQRGNRNRIGLPKRSAVA